MTIQMPNPNERADGLQRNAPFSLPVGDDVELLLSAVLGQLSLHMAELCFCALEELDSFNAPQTS